MCINDRTTDRMRAHARQPIRIRLRLKSWLFTLFSIVVVIVVVIVGAAVFCPLNTMEKRGLEVNGSYVYMYIQTYRIDT